MPTRRCSPLRPSLVLVALAFAPVGVVAQMEPDWTQQARSVDFTSDAASFRFASVRAGHEDEERLSGIFDLRAARFHWGFQANRSAPTQESLVEFAALLEWRDKDRDGSLGIGDEVVRRQPLDDLANASLVVVPRAPEGRTVHATYVLPGADAGPLDPVTGRRLLPQGGVTLSFHVHGAGATLGSSAPDATRMPMEIRIEKWPRTQNDTLLGLELALRSTGTMAISDDAWRATHAPVAHEVSWAERYVTNGSARSSRVTALERPGDAGVAPGRAQTTLLVSYHYGDVLHSWSFGTQPEAQGTSGFVEIVSTLLGDPRTYAVGASLCALTVGATALRALRRQD